MKYRLPDNKETNDAEEYEKQWNELGKNIKVIFGKDYFVDGYNPYIHISKRRNNENGTYTLLRSMVLTVEFCEKLNELYYENVRLKRILDKDIYY